MQKAKKYDWKDSNIANFGSDEDRKVKKESAETEPAWKGAGQKVGIQIWRINKFKVEHWPKEDYGTFFNGDSYIILNTYKEKDSEGLLYDVHFWIGEYSSQDEYGTAAYKTVELDTFLDDKPIQHREVSTYESSMFKSYFDKIQLMKGGVDTGFRKVRPEEYKPRLLHFHGDKKKVFVKEVPWCKKSIDDTDVHIYDYGLKLVLWIGKKSNKDESFRAVQYLQTLKSDRHGRVKECITYDKDDKEYKSLVDALPDDYEEGDDGDTCDPIQPIKLMFRLSDASGSMEMNKESEGSIPEDKLDPNDVFICDIGTEVFVWVGRNTSREEKNNALPYAHNYLQGTDHPCASVTCIKDGEPGRANAEFAKILD